MFDGRSAAVLAALPAERVGVVDEDATPPRQESVAVICALLREGAAFRSLSERFTPADRRWLVEQMDPIGLIADEHGENGKVEVAVAVVADQGVEVEDLRAELSVAAHVTIWPELPTTPYGKPAVARITAMLATEFDTETNFTR